MAVTSMANSSIRDFAKFRDMSGNFYTEFGGLQYVVVAGGGGGGSDGGGGGGAGGYRSSVFGETTGGGFPAETPLTLSAGQFHGYGWCRWCWYGLPGFSGC